MVQGSDNSIICNFVFGELPEIYKMVCDLKPKMIGLRRTLRNTGANAITLVTCGECDFKASNIDMRMHIKARHKGSKKKNDPPPIMVSTPKQVDRVKSGGSIDIKLLGDKASFSIPMGDNHKD